MARTLKLLAGAAVLAAAVASASATTSASGQATASTVKIGISLSLSGDFSDSGKAAMRGYQLWRDVINAHGGLACHQLVLHSADVFVDKNGIAYCTDWSGAGLYIMEYSG